MQQKGENVVLRCNVLRKAMQQKIDMQHVDMLQKCAKIIIF
jgi:hypothetical protein